MKISNQVKGDNYEAFVLNTLKPEYDDIWLWKNVPECILYKCGVIKDYSIFCKYRNLGDMGIDIVAVKNDIPYFIQCKNFSNTILLDSLAGFYFFLYENDIKTGMLCYNGNLSKRVIDLSSKINIRNIPYENEKVIIKQIPTVIVPKEYQIEAYKFLKDKHRGILSLPCGMGKTYCACMVANKHDNIIIISPLRELAKQNLESFSTYFNNEYKSILISVDGERDITKIKLGKKNIISLTYDSVDVLNKIISELKNVIIVIDEFHNISENSINGNTEMTKILKSDKKILFLSATPKHTEHKKIFGEYVFSYDWSKAIANKYINDFDIVLPSKEQSIETFNKLLKSINNDYEHNKMACKIYFLLKCILYNGDRKIIVFFATHEKMSEGIEIIGWLSKIFNIDINVDRIDCDTSCKNRTRIINIFTEIGGISILCCVRVLNEGINIECCDAAFITQPNMTTC
jgi:superfamily II DNA or RNA helicase